MLVKVLCKNYYSRERERGLWRVLPNVQGLLVLLVSSEQWRS